MYVVYIVTTSAEECVNPQRDLPIGIIGSLLISSLLYVGVSLVLVGMIPYQTIDTGNLVYVYSLHINIYLYMYHLVYLLLLLQFSLLVL